MARGLEPRAPAETRLRDPRVRAGARATMRIRPTAHLLRECVSAARHRPIRARFRQGSSIVPLPPERHDQQIQRAQLPLLPVCWYPYGYLILVDVQADRAVQPVPDVEHVGVIRIGLSMHDGVVNPVHSRRDDDPAQESFQPVREPRVAVVKRHRSLEGNLIHEHDARPRTDQGYACCSKYRAKQHLREVEANCGRYPEVEIGVVHVVEPP